MWLARQHYASENYTLFQLFSYWSLTSAPLDLNIMINNYCILWNANIISRISKIEKDQMDTKSRIGLTFCLLVCTHARARARTTHITYFFSNDLEPVFPSTELSFCVEFLSRWNWYNVEKANAVLMNQLTSHEGRHTRIHTHI